METADWNPITDIVLFTTVTEVQCMYAKLYTERLLHKHMVNIAIL